LTVNRDTGNVNVQRGANLLGDVLKISVVGVGIMGGAIARRLLACGHQVTLYGPHPAKLAPLVDLGARLAPSAALAAQASRPGGYVITCLNSAAIVRAAVLQPGGAAQGMDASQLLIDMSSIAPDATRALGEELRQRCGAGWVDAPLSGGAPKALLGQLTVMAGGTAQDMLRARTVLQDLCANLTHMGPAGAGQTTKLVNQMLCAIQFQAVAEAVCFAQANGVDATHLSLALAGGRADSQILREFGPKMAARDLSPTGRIDNMLKDLEAVQALSQAQRLPLPATALVAELHRSFVAAGWGPEDAVAMMKQFHRQGLADADDPLTVPRPNAV
jgi:2-hydroxy-3-oxopropionate reductase